MMIAAIILASSTAACGPTVSVYETLKQKYQEDRVFSGIAENGVLFEVWESDATWTSIVTTPNGMPCMIASGKTAGCKV